MTLRSLMRPAKANDLFAKLSETSDGAVKTRERLFAELKAELEFHTSLEEQHLFPVLRRTPETKDLVAPTRSATTRSCVRKWRSSTAWRRTTRYSRSVSPSCSRCSVSMPVTIGRSS